MPFRIEPVSIGGAKIIEPTLLSDHRGSFLEIYKRSAFAEAGLPETVAQENVSISHRGVLRGLHYQRAPHGQDKLVRVVRGEIFDVLVDLREEAAPGARWIGITLSAANRRMLYVPQWCAHGFCVTSDEAEVVYMTSSEYSPQHEWGIAWNDPALKIDWPVDSPILSARDQNWPPFHTGSETPATTAGKTR